MNPVRQIPSQREFLALAVPNMLAGLAIPVTQLVDIAYLGRLETVAPLSGVVLATVIFDFIFWCFAFLRVGTTGLVAQANGRNDKDEEAALFWRAIFAGLGIGSALLVLQVPIGWISFELLAGDAAVEAQGYDYYRTHIWGSIPVMLNLAIIGWLLGQGRSGMVWALNTVWQCCNIGLNYWFILHLGWGAFGAGLGTALSEWISLLVGLGLVMKCWGGVPSLSMPHILHWDRIRELFTLNSAIMLRTLTLMCALAAFTNISATFGTVALAANALIMKLFLFYTFVVDGFAIALETFAGRSQGRGNREELRRSFYLSMLWSLSTALVFMLAYLLGANVLLSLLTEHEEVVAAATLYVPHICAALLIGGVAFVFDGFFYGLARPRLLFRSMLYSVLAYAPLAAYAWWQQDSHWLWIAFITMTATRAITLTPPALKHLRDG